MNTSRRILFPFLAVLLTACSVEISDDRLLVTRLPVTSTPAPTATSARAAPKPSPGFALSPIPAVPTRARATARPTQPSQIPMTWAGLHLTGQIVFTQDWHQVVKLDLATGVLTTLLRPPDESGTDSLVSAASVSPDGKQIALAYAPPITSTNGEPPTYGGAKLYLMPADGSGPPVLLVGGALPGPQEEFFSPL